MSEIERLNKRQDPTIGCLLPLNKKKCKTTVKMFAWKKNL